MMSQVDKFKRKFSVRLKDDQINIYRRYRDLIKQKLIEIARNKNVDIQKVKSMDNDVMYGTICTIALPLQEAEELKEFLEKNNLKMSKLVRYIISNISNNEVDKSDIKNLNMYDTTRYFDHKMSVEEKSDQLSSLIEEVKNQAKSTGKPASKIIKIKNADNIVLQLNAVPNGNDVRLSLTIHRRNNYRKQIGIIVDDAQSLLAIAKFLQNYADTLNKYIKFTNGRRSPNEVEIELEEDEPQQQQKKQTQKKNKNVEDEF